MRDGLIIIKSKRFVSREIGDKTYLYDLLRQRIHVFNKSASFIWKNIKNKRTCEDIMSIIAGKKKKDAVDYAVRLKKIVLFVEKIKTQGIVTYAGK